MTPQQRHLCASLAKSALRIWAGGLLVQASADSSVALVGGAGVLFVLAEILGIVEELVL